MAKKKDDLAAITAELANHERASKEFVTVVVGSRQLEVALTEDAGRYKIGILAASMQSLLMDQIEKFRETNAIIAPGELESLIKAGGKVADLHEAQFARREKGAPPPKTSSPVTFNIGVGAQQVPQNATEAKHVVDLGSAPVVGKVIDG